MPRQPNREEVRRRVRERSGKPAEDAPAAEPVGDTPGNLLMAELAMRMGSLLLRRGVEKAFLKRKIGEKAAERVTEKRSVLHTMGAAAVARVATGSVPGAALVGAGMAGKLLFDKAKRRRARQKAALPTPAPEESKSSDT